MLICNEKKLLHATFGLTFELPFRFLCFTCIVRKLHVGLYLAMSPSSSFLGGRGGLFRAHIYLFSLRELCDIALDCKLWLLMNHPIYCDCRLKFYMSKCSDYFRLVQEQLLESHSVSFVLICWKFVRGPTPICLVM